ncbi:uncharacterized protein LOC129588364 [Paramacrobiotus metropolitanus]|uniref:uncharacterized protein LOC129588364 n=1 Tax=Paramacrobiotus metropolitanus TaxID=2943436 RepID=UPI0024462F10|nr:uncharacterized protein LOC129588364 [Paramacrobiotus metropolitanus]
MDVTNVGQLHNRAAVVTFGALQVSIGILFFLLNIIDLAINVPGVFMNSVWFSGIWMGGFFILTGSFGIVAGRFLPPGIPARSRQGFLVTALVLSVLSLTSTIIVTPFSFIFPILVGPYEHNQLIPLGITYFTLYLVMFIVNLGQLVSTSVNIHKLHPSAPTVVYMVNVPSGVPTHQFITTAIAQPQPAPIVVGLPVQQHNPPPYVIEQALATHPKF